MKAILIILAAICAIIVSIALRVLVCIATTFVLTWILGLFGISTFLGFPLFQTILVISLVCSLFTGKNSNE